ncbi:MAG: helix-turn-helix domain-containing protein [Nitrososphaerota archaeon]|nr:helix-turn-helix domain-containing protein [Nitrososphaerota archaeon]
MKKRYGAVARTLSSSEILRISGGQAARIIGLSRRRLQRVVKRFRQEGIAGLRLKSTRPHSSPNRTSLRIDRDHGGGGKEGHGLRC